jgi:tripartite-type tricarboxylate transporter receptor subunit TctC
LIADAATALPYLGGGRIKALAVMAKAKMAVAPDIPTVDETGLPEFYASLWYGLWAPAKTPDDIIAKVNAAAVNALSALTAALHHLFWPRVWNGSQPAEPTKWPPWRLQP